ncbi:hypothetical protein X797_009164 [Metarhizium robertsii]|uniref:Uncharacterized protein n=1 Tax=Metarhizium robertsii TaxID=568076 RepID=A0A0A1UQS7_9HYPO|nr:hypothetical protein X797_009164 [Metarhizium robertsii]
MANLTLSAQLTLSSKIKLGHLSRRRRSHMLYGAQHSLRTLYCSSLTAPECVTFQIAADDSYSGYSIMGCGPSKKTYIVYPTTTGQSTSTTITSETSSTSTTSMTTTPPPLPLPSPSTPVGAIVGGVVGGIAALALIGLAGFFLVQQKKKKASGPIQQPIVSQYYPLHMDRASQGGGPDYDQTHRSSVARSPMNFATGSTSPEYQSQPVFAGTNKLMTSAPGYTSGYNIGQPVEMQGQQSL